jgi:hypothetical protein
MRGLAPEYEDMGRRARPRGGQKRASANRSAMNAQTPRGLCLEGAAPYSCMARHGLPSRDRRTSKWQRRASRSEL